ncbi:MAG: hypothetical protein FRX49_06933 [Trebouxia sp. A1-2]|nr:MAG: hypothetical protein FRX49_06933 [Trebouxia sp. A1-2]
MATAAFDVPNAASHLQCLFGAADTGDIRDMYSDKLKALAMANIYSHMTELLQSLWDKDPNPSVILRGSQARSAAEQGLTLYQSPLQDSQLKPCKMSSRPVPAAGPDEERMRKQWGI